MFLKEAHQGYIYLIKNIMNINIVKYYYREYIFSNCIYFTIKCIPVLAA